MFEFVVGSNSLKFDFEICLWNSPNLDKFNIFIEICQISNFKVGIWRARVKVSQNLITLYDPMAKSIPIIPIEGIGPVFYDQRNERAFQAKNPPHNLTKPAVLSQQMWYDIVIQLCIGPFFLRNMQIRAQIYVGYLCVKTQVYVHFSLC